MLVVELLNRDATAGESTEAALYLIDMLPQFGFDGRRRLQVVESNLQRCIHLAPPDGPEWAEVPLRSATRPTNALPRACDGGRARLRRLSWAIPAHPLNRPSLSLLGIGHSLSRLVL
jgi:hypothetical protein